MNALRNRFKCLMYGHDWDYFSIELVGKRIHIRRCLRCGKVEQIEIERAEV